VIQLLLLGDFEETMGAISVPNFGELYCAVLCCPHSIVQMRRSLCLAMLCVCMCVKHAMMPYAQDDCQ